NNDAVDSYVVSSSGETICHRASLGLRQGCGDCPSPVDGLMRFCEAEAKHSTGLGQSTHPCRSLTQAR
ncbi:hypothetical protein J6590_100120, partial [Homalodisca vitripennis]